MSKDGCELCNKPARMFCESDQASLCWECDEKVHAANFLVAKHSRTLLCNVCHSPTPWKASGLNIGPTVSVCHGCAGEPRGGGGATTPSSRREEDGGSDSPESESDDGDYCSESEGVGEENEEDGENQVVPWSDSGSDSPQPQPPPRTEGSSCCGSEGPSRNLDLNLQWDENCNLDLNLQWDENCSSSSSSRPTKRRQAEERAPLTSSAIAEKLRRFHQKIVAGEGDASAMICRD